MDENGSQIPQTNQPHRKGFRNVMSIQNPLENYGLERIRMEEDDRYVWVYYAGKVENVVTKLTKENEELKAKLETVQATAYAESVDAGMRERKLKRALYKALESWAHEAKFDYDDEFSLWDKMERKCLKKAEEYK